MKVAIVGCGYVGTRVAKTLRDKSDRFSEKPDLSQFMRKFYPLVVNCQLFILCVVKLLLLQIQAYPQSSHRRDLKRLPSWYSEWFGNE